MSVRKRQAETVLRAAVICGFIGSSLVAAAADDELPDLELLEYLGSWEESDEEWLLFTADAQETAAQEKVSQEDGRTSDREPDSAPIDKKSTELEENEG